MKTRTTNDSRYEYASTVGTSAVQEYSTILCTAIRRRQTRGVSGLVYEVLVLVYIRPTPNSHTTSLTLAKPSMHTWVTGTRGTG